MISAVGAWLNDRMKRWMPDPFVFAAILTLVTVGLAVGLTRTPIQDVLLFWRGTDWKKHGAWEAGFWSFLLFGMQMCLILVTGFALATAPIVKRLLGRLADLPKTTGGAAAMVSFAAMIAALLNWGFGLIVGAFLARETAASGRRRGLVFHYPLLGAAGYAGLMIWHGGFSGSAPLDVAGNGVQVGAVLQVLPITSMLFSPYNLAITGALLVLVPALFAAMAPKRDVVEIVPVDDPAPPPREKTPAAWLEHSPILTILLAAMGLGVVGWDLYRHGPKYFDLYSVPFLFLFLAMLLHWRPSSLIRAVEQGAKGCAGILLQFPFYAGIYGIMMGTGLHEVMAGWCKGSTGWVAAKLSLPEWRVYPVLVFFAAGAINLFIPSGGGQWKVQGPVVCAAGAEMGVPLDRTVMAVAYGDELTNMLQPFWALALLGITGLHARQIMGYTAAAMLFALPVYVAAMLLL
jgi:short-chain fatty acids transporter